MRKLALVLLLSGLLGCTGELEICKFQGGEMVRTTLGNVQGQIVGIYKTYGACSGYYEVRFQANESVTNARILSDDGPIAGRPFQKVRMYHYELKKEGA